MFFREKKMPLVAYISVELDRNVLVWQVNNQKQQVPKLVYANIALILLNTFKMTICGCLGQSSFSVSEMCTYSTANIMYVCF